MKAAQEVIVTVYLSFDAVDVKRHTLDNDVIHRE